MATRKNFKYRDALTGKSNTGTNTSSTSKTTVSEKVASKINPTYSAKNVAKEIKSGNSLSTGTSKKRYSSPKKSDDSQYWMKNALDLYKEGQKKKDYDSTFSKDFFRNTPEMDELLNVSLEDATPMQAIMVANTFRQIQAGNNYRTKTGEGADYTPGESQYGLNDSVNQNYNNWINKFKATATENDVSEALKYLEKIINEAGNYDSDYKTRTRQDYNDLYTWAGNTYSKFAYRQVSEKQTEIAEKQHELRTLGVYNAGVNESDAAKAQTALGSMFAGNGDPIAIVRNDEDLKRITDFDNLAKKYSDPEELADALFSRLTDFNNKAASSSYDAAQAYQYAAINNELATLEGELEDLIRKRDSIVEREKYIAMLGDSTSTTSLAHFNPKPYEIATQYSRRNMETGQNETFYEYNAPTLAQMVADPEGVWEKYQQASAHSSVTGSANEIDLVRRMTEEERIAYKNMYAGYGEEEANNFFDVVLRDQLNARQTQQLAYEYAANAKEHPVASYLSSFGHNLISGIADVANGARMLLGQAPVDNQFDAVTNAQRRTGEQMLKDATKWANFNFLGQEGKEENAFVWLLRGLTAGVDEGINALTFGPLRNVHMGLRAGSRGAVENYERYGDIGNALLSGLGSAAAEYGSERLGDIIGNTGFLKYLDNMDSFGKMAGYLAKGTLGEFFEEGLSNVGSTALDTAAGEITGVGSEIADRIRYLKANGYTQEEAWGILAKEYGQEVLQDAIIGGIAGLGMSGSNVAATVAYDTAYDNSVNRVAGSLVQHHGNVAAVLREGLKNPDEGVRKISQRLINKLNLEDPSQDVLPNDPETKAELDLVQEAVSEADSGKQFDQEKQDKHQQRTNELKEAAEQKKQNLEEKSGDQKAAAKEKIENVKLTRSQRKQVGQVYRKVLAALDVDVEARRTDLRKGIEERRAELAKAVDEKLRKLGERPIAEVSEAIAAVALGDPDVTIDQLDIAEAYAAREGVVKELWDAYKGSVDKQFDYLMATDRKLKAASDRANKTLPKIKENAGKQMIGVTGDISYTTDEGETITGKLESFAPGKNGEVAAVVDGKIVEIDRLEIGDEGRDKLFRYAAELRNADAANAMYEGIEEGQDVESYASGFEAAYHYGEIGIDISSVKDRATVKMLSDKQFESAYVTGAAAAAARPRIAAAKTGGKISFADGLDQRLDGLNANQKSAINVLTRLAEIGGINIEIFESKADKKGSYAAYENGRYLRNTNTLCIDINAGKDSVDDLSNYAMLRSASHELTHYIQAQNPEAYKRLQDFIINNLDEQGGDGAFDELVKQKMEQFELSYVDAVDEVIADGCEMMLKSSTAIQRLAQKDKNLFMRIRDWMRDFAKNVRLAFRGVSAHSDEARLLKNVQGLQKLWDDALVGAIENVRSAQNSSTPATEAATDAMDAIEGGAGTSFEPSAHIDQRTDESIQTQEPFFNSFDELKDVFAYNMAREIQNDIAKSVPGQKIFNWNSGTSQPEVMAQKRATTDLITAYKDKYNWTWDGMQKLVDRFIEHCENGTPIPNTLGMKRLEMMIDDALTNGYTNMDGTKIASAVEYVREKGKIEGAIQHNADAESDGVPWAEYVFGEDVKFSKRIRDTEYQAAYEAGDENLASELVNQAAIAAGYNPLKLYHGTGKFGFTRIDPSMADDGLSFFTTTNERTAETYSGESNIRRVSGKTSMTIDDLHRADADTLLKLLRKHVNAKYEIVSETERNKLIAEENDAIRAALNKAYAFERDNVEVFKDNIEARQAIANITHAMTKMYKATKESEAIMAMIAFQDAFVDLRFANSDLSFDLAEQINTDVHSAYSRKLSYMHRFMFKISERLYDEYASYTQVIDELHPKLFRGIYELYGRTENLLEVDAEGRNWNHLDGEAIGRYGFARTRDYAEYAKTHGYDGVHFKNIRDNGGQTAYSGESDVYTFFNPSDVKSADPFTFNDDGDLIPLSERFNRADEDIRYSRRRKVDTDPAEDYNTDGIKWIYDAELLNKQQQRQLHDAHREISHRGFKAFTTTSDGEYIIPVDGAIIFSNGQYKNPAVSAIIELDVSDPAETVAMLNEVFRNGKRSGYFDKHQAWAIVDSVFKEGTAEFFHRRVRGKNEDIEHRRSGENSRYASYEGKERRNEEPVDEGTRFQKRNSSQISDRELLANAFESVAQNDNERGYLEKYKEQIEELDGKQIELAKIRREIRDMMFTPGERDAAYKDKLASLKSKANSLAEVINRADKRLITLEGARPLRDVLARERAKADKRAAENRRESLRAAKERRDTTELRHKIRRLSEDFNRRLLRPTERNYVPRDLVQLVIAAQELVDTRSGREGVKAQEKLAQIKAVYERYKADSQFAYVYDPVIDEMLQKLTETAGGKNIYQLNKAELTDIYNTLKALRKQVSEAVQLKAGTYAANVIEAGREMYRETSEAAPLAKGKLGDYLNWQLTPDKFFARLAGHKKNSIWSGVAKSFSDGTERMLEIQRAAYYHFRKWTESKEFDKLNSLKNLIDIGLKDENGNAVKITRGMMLDAYMHLSSEDNMRAFMYGGFSVPNLKKYYAGKVAESYGTGSVNTIGTSMELAELAEQLRDPNLTDDQRAAIQQRMDEAEERGMDRINIMRANIESKLTAWDKGLIAAVHEWNDVISRDYINEVTMDIYGIKRAQVDNYYKINRDTAFVNSDFESISRNVNLENWGSLKDRVPSRAPILLGDIAFTVDNGVNQMSRYVGYVRAQRDFSKLYNVRMPGMAGSVKKIVGTKFGAGERSLGASGEQYIENYIGSITGSRHAEGDFLSVIRRNLPRATMTLNARVAFSQLSAIPKAAAEVGWDSMISGFANEGMRAIFSKKAREELAQQNVWFWQRYRGEGGQREFADMKGGTGLIDKAWNKVDDVTKGWLLNWCQDFDVMSTVSMWSMAKAWARKNGYKDGTAEFTEAANRKYTDILRNTQAANTVSERSDLARNTKASLSLLTMYKSEAFANFNMFYDAVAKLHKYGQDAKTGKNNVSQADVKRARLQVANTAVSVVVGASLTNAILKLAVNALTSAMSSYRDEEDEITLKSTLSAIASEVAGDTVGMLVFGGEIYDVFSAAVLGEHYYGPGDMALTELTETLEYVVNVFQKEDATLEDYQKAGSKIFVNVCNMLGIPYNNVKRQAVGLHDTIADIAAGEAFSFEASADRSNSTNYRRMLKASIEGDDAKYMQVMAELEEKGVDIKDAQEGYRSKVKEAFEEGEIDRDKAMDLISEYGGKSADDAFWMVEKWEYNGEGNYSKYGELRAALAAGNSNEAAAAVEELLAHGVKEQSISSELSELYNKGDATTILALQMRPTNMYTPSKPKNSDDDFDAFLAAVLAGGDVKSEISKLKKMGYSHKNIMSALNGAFGKSSDRYAIMVKKNPKEAAILEERILDAYVALGLNRESERTWIHENWTMPEDTEDE